MSGLDGRAPTRQAIILAGGKGTRLGELARDMPKPLMPIVGERRFLDYLIEQVARQGFDDIVIVAGHLGEQVVERYHGQAIRGAGLRVVREPAPLGTGGALTAIGHLLAPSFLMMNGDAFVDCNLRGFERAAAVFDGPTIATLAVDDSRRYGTVEIAGSQVTAFREKDPAASGPAMINAGIYRLDRSVLERVGRLPASMETDIFPSLASVRRLHAVPISGWFIDIGLADTLERARRELPTRTRRPCAFFDRDGTLNHDAGYTHRVADLKWTDGARDAVRRLNDLGYLVVVCTNQSGVARGYYGEAEVQAFHAAMRAELAEAGAFIDAFYFCPYHREAVDARYRRHSPDRKPGPGMLLRAMEDWSIDPQRSFMIGDAESDLLAARAAGIPGYRYAGGSLDETVRTALESAG